jgi:hypothetical protein
VKCHRDPQTRRRQQGYAIGRIWLSCEFHYQPSQGQFFLPQIWQEISERVFPIWDCLTVVSIKVAAIDEGIKAVATSQQGFKHL